MKHYLDKVKLLQKIVIISPEGKILALRRGFGDVSRPGAWDLPGGILDERDRENYTLGKNLAVSSILREVVEETKLKVLQPKPIYVDAVVEKSGVLVFLTGYQGMTRLMEVNLSEEHIDFKWVTCKEFMKLDVGKGGEFLKKIVERVIL